MHTRTRIVAIPVRELPHQGFTPSYRNLVFQRILPQCQQQSVPTVFCIPIRRCLAHHVQTVQQRLGTNLSLTAAKNELGQCFRVVGHVKYGHHLFPFPQTHQRDRRVRALLTKTNSLHRPQIHRGTHRGNLAEGLDRRGAALRLHNRIEQTKLFRRRDRQQTL